MDKPINTTILDWYEKIAENMTIIDHLIEKFCDHGGRFYTLPKDALHKIKHSAYDLLQARRNEPEYSVALAEFQAIAANIKGIISHKKPRESLGVHWDDLHDRKLLKQQKQNLKQSLDEILLVARSRETPPSFKQPSYFI